MTQQLYKQKQAQRRRRPPFIIIITTNKVSHHLLGKIRYSALEFEKKCDLWGSAADIGLIDFLKGYT